jgi:hypothetical protein
MKSVAFASLSLSLVACYGAAPPRPPRVPLPPIQEGAELEVHTDQKTTIENVAKTAWSCPAGHAEGDPACTKTTYTEAEPVTRTTTTANIGSEPLTYAQFKVITDPKWNDKLVELEDLSHKCQRANVPRYVGLGMLAVSLIGGPLISAYADPTAGSIVTYGGALAGGGSYALGYFAFGGRDCNEARALYTYLDTSQDGVTMVNGAEIATEMKTLADQFNSTHGTKSAENLKMRR